MKSLFLAAALAGVSVTASAFAFSPKDPAAPAPTPRPVPSYVVKPTALPLNFTGALVEIEFTLDKSGQPQEIRLPSVKDPQLKRTLVEAFRQWRFVPGADGSATRKRYILPLVVRAET